MTLRQKIEVMEAFERGEEIESAVDSDGNDGDYDWETDYDPLWDWDDFIYRIKDEDKFKIGDKVVRKEYCNGIIPLKGYVSEIADISDYAYLNSNGDIIGLINDVDENYINADECLWYWDFLDHGVWFLSSFRCTLQELKVRYENMTDYEISYGLGARLPERN